MTRSMSPLGSEWLGDLPPWYRQDTHVQAVVDCLAREHERLRDWTRLIRLAPFPELCDPIFYPIHERMNDLVVNPEGLTATQRLARIRAAGAKRGDTSGLNWEDDINQIIGTNWSYKEPLPEEFRATNLAINPKAAGGRTGVSVLSTVNMTDMSLNVVACTWHRGISDCWEVTATNANDSSLRELIFRASTSSGRSAVPINPDRTYAWSLYVHTVDPSVGTSTNRGYQIQVIWYDASGATISTTAGNQIPDEGVSDVRLTQVARSPANAAYASFQCKMRTDSPLDVVRFQCTGLLIQESEEVNEYVDGSTNEWEWLGTADSSISRELYPDAGVMWFTIPYGSGLAQASEIRRMIRAKVPAHFEIVVNYDQGFILGVSRLGSETF